MVAVNTYVKSTYQGRCDCGWHGHYRNLLANAQDDVRKHVKECELSAKRWNSLEDECQSVITYDERMP